MSLFIPIISSPLALLGYVGPPGIGALGMVLILAVVLLLGLVGLLLYPVRLLLRLLRGSAEEEPAPDTDNVPAESPTQPEALEQNS